MTQSQPLPQPQQAPKREFAWKSDHAFVKISAEESDGRYTLIEDNLTAEFRLPLHLHREHAEAFYLVSGEVEFTVREATNPENSNAGSGAMATGQRIVRLTPGNSLFIPPGVPHSVRCVAPAKMLTLYQPGGLELLFEAYAAMSDADMADPAKLRAVDLAHDNVVLEG